MVPISPLNTAFAPTDRVKCDFSVRSEMELNDVLTRETIRVMKTAKPTKPVSASTPNQVQHRVVNAIPMRAIEEVVVVEVL